MSTLTLRDVGVRVGARALLAHVDLTLGPGQFTALIGPNGAGKTTALRAALGLVPHTGAVTLDGRPLSAWTARDRAAALGWLPQHPVVREALPVVDVVAAARFRFAEGRGAARDAARAALSAVGADALADAPADRLSGGEAQRVALATLLAQEADLLLLDEPANHLDPAVQRETWQRLGAWWRAGRGLLVVTHDLNLLAHLGAPEAVSVVALREGGVAFRLPLDHPDLPDAVGALYGVDVRAVSVGAHRHLVLGAPT